MTTQEELAQQEAEKLNKWSNPDQSGDLTPEQIEKMSTNQMPAGAVIKDANAPIIIGTPKGNETFTPDPLWEELKVVENFKMPEGLTKENETEFLKKALVDNKLAETTSVEQVKKPMLDDPEIAAYYKYKEANPTATLNDFMAQKNQINDFLNMSDRDFMIEHYTREFGLYDEKSNPDGLTPEQINETVDALDNSKQLTIESKKLKREYRKLAESTANVPEEQINKQKNEERDITVNKMREDAKKLFAETEKISELNGVKLSKAEITEINAEFEKAILPNEQGRIPIFDMLQSDRILWNFFATNYLGDNKIKAAVFNAADSTKENLMSRLGLKPIVNTGRQSDTGKRNTVTPGLWSSPDPADM